MDTRSVYIHKCGRWNIVQSRKLHGFLVPKSLLNWFPTKVLHSLQNKPWKYPRVSRESAWILFQKSLVLLKLAHLFKSSIFANYKMLSNSLYIFGIFIFKEQRLYHTVAGPVLHIIWGGGVSYQIWPIVRINITMVVTSIVIYWMLCFTTGYETRLHVSVGSCLQESP